MVTFFADIDNTLIFSHRQKYAGEKMTAEFLYGKEQSYMTKELFYFLKQNEDVMLVPVTTRSIKQYKRLFLFRNELACRYVLTCNGGILLINDEMDSEWRMESLRISEMQNEEVWRLYQYLNNFVPENKIHKVEEFMFYVAPENLLETYKLVLKTADREKVFIGKDSRKIYIVAESINKGEAVRRFQKRYEVGRTIIAGDSEFDIPMLKMGNIGIAPQYIQKKMHRPDVVVSESDMLAGEIGKILENMKNRGLFL